MKRIVFITLMAVALSIVLSSCMFFATGQQTPVQLVWHIQNPGLGDAYFAYDKSTGILFIRGEDASTSTVMAVNFMDKKVLWKKVYPCQMGTAQEVATYDGKVYILEDQIFPPTIPGLVALDEKTGKQIWKLPFEKKGVYNGLTIYNGYIYTFGGGHFFGSYIYKVDCETGRVIWKVPIQGADDTSPIIDKEYGYVYFGTSIDPNDGKDPRYFYAIDIHTGKVVWKTAIQPNGWTDNFTTVPVIYGDSVYAGTWFGKVVRLDRKTGKIIWQLRLMDKSDGTAYNLQGTRFYVYEKKLETVLTSGIILALNVKDGSVAWEKDVSTKVYALMDLCLHNGKIYVHGWGPNIGCFSAKNGDELWLYTPPSIPGAEARTCGAPMVIGDYLVDANCNGDFYVMKLENQ